jgi:hypothetical protein
MGVSLLFYYAALVAGVIFEITSIRGDVAAI